MAGTFSGTLLCFGGVTIANLSQFGAGAPKEGEETGECLRRHNGPVLSDCESGAAGGRAAGLGDQGKQVVQHKVGLLAQVDAIREVQPVDDVAIQGAV